MTGRTNAAGMKVFASVSVKYPEGSTCVCRETFVETVTDETTGETTRTVTGYGRVLKAKGSGGAYLFMLPYGGFWTLSCSHEATGRSREKMLEITHEHQSESVELTYILYLFNEGDTCEAVTGGWSKAGYSYYSGYSYPAPSIGDSITVKTTDSGQSCIAGTGNKIDFTGYSLLCAEVTAVTKLSGIYVVGDSKNVRSDIPAWAKSAVGTVQVPLEELQGSYYIALVSTSSSDHPSNKGVYSKIWLE